MKQICQSLFPQKIIFYIKLTLIIFNSFIAYTALVVEGFETIKFSDKLSVVQQSLLGAVQQHYVSLFGFTLATVVQLINTLKGIKETK